MRLYKIDRGSVENVVSRSDVSAHDPGGNPVLTRRIADGGLVRVVVALDRLDFVITLYPVRQK